MSNYYNRQWRLPNNENKDKQSNYSMDFDGSSSQYISAGSGSGITGSNPFSMSVWFKLASAPSGYPMILSTGKANNLNENILYISPSYKLAWGNSNANNDFTNSSGTTLSLNTWYHGVVTFNGSDTVKIYVNGSLDGSKTDVSGVNIEDIDIVIGARTNNGNTGKELYFDGSIDGAAIFNYELSSSQITTLYGSSSTGIGNPMSLSPKPVAYYPLGDQDSFNGADYLVPNSSLKDYVFFVDNLYQSTSTNGVTMGSYSDTAGLSAVSWSLWVNLQVLNSASGYSRILNSDSFYFATNASNGGLNWTFAFVTVNGAISKNFTFSTALQNQGWVNIIGTYDGTNTKFYLNTAQQGTQGSGSGVLNTTSSLNLGYFYASNSVDAYFSNFSIWNKELSTSDISEIYNSGTPSNLSSHSSTSNLINWWKLDASDTYDSSTGNWTFEDHAGSSNATSSGMTQANLVQSNLSFTSGYSPYALSFDGVSDYIDSNFSLTTGQTQFSASIWVKFTGSLGSDESLIANESSYAGDGFAIFKNTSNQIVFKCESQTAIGTTTISLNKWYLATATYNAGAMILYVNGQQEATQTTATSITQPSTPKTRLGKYITANAIPFTGELSNASVWNAALTSSQVTEIYSEGVPSNLNNHSAYSNLVSWWQLGSNSSFNSSLNQWTCIDEKGTNTGESSQTFNEDAIVDGVGSYANGLSSGMGGDEVVGDAPYSTSNALSVNMDVEDRTTDTPS